MKRYFTILAALALGVCASAQVVYSIDFSSCTAAVETTTAATLISGSDITGATIVGEGTFEFTPKSGQKAVVDKQTCANFDKVNGSNNIYGLKIQGGTEVIKLAIKDGFLEDDVIKVTGYISTTDKSKSVCLKMTIEGGEESFVPDGYTWDSENNCVKSGSGFANAKSEGSNPGSNPSAIEFTMQGSADYVNFARQSALSDTGKNSATNAYITKIEVIRGGSTPIANINADAIPAGKAIKTIENGKVIIIRDGVKYNMNGAVVK